MKKWDYIIFVFIAVLSVACFVFVQSYTSERGSVVVIELNGQIVKQLSLNEDTSYVVGLMNETEDYNEIVIKDGYVRVIESNCRDQICVNTPAISQVGQSIICLPHRLVVRIDGYNQKIDGVSR